MVIEINSVANARYKSWQKLLTRKYRDSSEKYIIEGANLIEDAFDAGMTIDEVVVRDSVSRRSDIGEAMASRKAAGLTEKMNIPVFALADSLYDKISDTENGRNVFAVIRRKKWRMQDFGPTRQEGRSKNIIILDRLQDPGNLGTVIRTADGAGFAGVIALKGTADAFAPKVVRAAAGSLFRLPVMYVDGAAEAFDICKKFGLKVAASGFDGAQEYSKADLSGGIALIIGNEGQGVLPEIQQRADVILKIPMFGRIDSLNAAVAAGILMYECKRQEDKR